jgi:nucleoside-diphosphate-sugar epimerase
LYLGRRGFVSDNLETDADNPSRAMYSRGKGMAERALLELHAREGLPVVIFRPGIVIGPGGPLAHFALGDAVADTRILGWGRGQNPLPCVLVDDAAKAMALAKDAPGVEGMAFNLVGDVRPTAQEFVEELRRRSLRDFRFYPRSLWKIQVGELTRLMMKKMAGKAASIAISYRDLKSLSMLTQFDCSSGKRSLGWSPVADREEFFRQAIDSLLEPILPGDLRLQPQMAEFVTASSGTGTS